MVDVQRQPFTVSGYYKMAEVGILKPSDRVELINDEIIRMSPIETTPKNVFTKIGNASKQVKSTSKYQLMIFFSKCRN